MPKKGRRDQLTGGTEDVNPQTLSIGIVQTGANVNALSVIPLPLDRHREKGSTVGVMELLRCEFTFGGSAFSLVNNNAFRTATIATISSLASVTQPGPSPNFADPHVITQCHEMNAVIGAPTNTFWIQGAYPIQMDLTDGAGHGTLLATDQLYVYLQSFGMGNPTSCGIKIWYRFKNVDVTEYIGIVQSQQT